MQNKLVNHTKKKSHDGLKMVLCLRLKSQIRLLDDVVTTFPGTAFLSLFETFKFKILVMMTSLRSRIVKT